ncbi:S8 family peptidase [Thalassomonas viridans]|uniref:S8 family peptidase n=1 Tax=Thalassomonas viridans TaxID=137584 RepID=UPI001F2E79E8|nr:S8 family peptidase [Thalassomonas viridans]
MAKPDFTDAQKQTQSYIISAQQYDLLKEKVAALNVTPSHELKIINALAVELTTEQLAQLQQQLDVKVTTNHTVELSAKGRAKRKSRPPAVINDLIAATPVQQQGNYGAGVTVAFLDTGLEYVSGLIEDKDGWQRFCGFDFCGAYDAITDKFTTYNYSEESGHGTHVASIAVNSERDANGKLYGIAPDAGLLGIKAFDVEGKATYADVIRGIGWAVAEKDRFNLRVLNMSFSGPVRSSYWEDPLNQAVMKAWSEGIVVVASSGNLGSTPMTVGVPGNVPYIITVGAMTDNYTPYDLSDDRLADFSSAGPTVEGFVKPDLIAPGGHIAGLMSNQAQIARDYPEYKIGGRYFEMSGTSQATAVVSGVAALMLAENPALTPDDVKCRLMSTAQAAVNSDGSLAYSVFQQGAGLIQALDAVNSTASGCANQGMDVALDAAGMQHYQGPASVDADKNFTIEGQANDYAQFTDEAVIADKQVNWQGDVATDIVIWKTSLVEMADNNYSMLGINMPVQDKSPLQSFFETDIVIWKTSVETDIVIWKTSLDFDASETISVNNWVEQQ